MTHQRDDERRALDEAALLPEDDPRRSEFVESLQDRDAWCAILAENEDLRLRLRSVDIPQGLTDRVRSARTGSRPSKRRRVSPVRGALIAAALVLVSALALFAVRSPLDAERTIYELATLAAMDHAARPELTVETTELETLVARLRGSAPFQLNIDAPEPGAVLTGGRVCSFGDRPLVYTRWSDADEDIAVYQVDRRAFGLRAGLSKTEVDIPEEGSPVSRCRVRIWSDTEFAYVVVHDQRRRDG